MPPRALHTSRPRESHRWTPVSNIKSISKGDHCSRKLHGSDNKGVPLVFEHHFIVIDVNYAAETITVVGFGPEGEVLPTSSGTTGKSPGIFHEETIRFVNFYKTYMRLNIYS